VTDEEKAASLVVFHASTSEVTRSAWNEEKKKELDALEENGRQQLFAELSDSCRRVTRMRGTEPRGLVMEYGGFDDHYERGTYLCACCKSELFESSTKFDCGCGWPGFWNCIGGSIAAIPDKDGTRTEIRCLNCDAHLGHVQRGEGFKNPPPNERHCINSSAICFRRADDPTKIEPAGYNGPIYMRSGRRIPTERSKFTELLGGERPDEHISETDVRLSAWLCFNTGIQTFRYRSGSSYDDLHQHVCGEMGLGPRTDLRVNIWTESGAEDDQIGHEVLQIRGNMTEIPEDATCFDVEHMASKKQKNSDKL
jgi:peptide-methionine (R)-S-oxide reductase